MKNVTGLIASINAAYDFESILMKDCANRPYPKHSAFNNWGKCVNSYANLLAADSDFDQRYMGKLSTHQANNWTELHSDWNEMLNEYMSMVTYCNRN